MANMPPLPPGFILNEATPASADPTPPIPEGFTPVPAEPDIDPQSFLGRVGSQVGDRLSKVERASQEYSAGDITYPEFAMRGLAAVYGSIYDTVGEGVMSILASVTPDEAEEFLKEQIAAGGTKLMNTEVAQEALQAWQALPQRTKDNLGDIGIIGTSMLPKGKAGKALYESGVASEKKKLASTVLNQSLRAKQARSKEMGLPKNMQNTLNREDAILNTVVSIPGIGASSSRETIMGALNKEIGRLGNQIQTSLGRVKTTVPKSTVNQNVLTSIKGFIEANPEFATKQLKPAVDKVMTAYQTAVKGYTGKPSELLKMRKDFDRIVENLFKKDVHAGDDVSRELVATVRNSINDTMEAIAPDDQIKYMMRRQHHALLARENVAYSMAAEPKLLNQVLQKMEQHPVLTAGALGGGGMVSKLLGSEPLGVGMALGAGAYGLSRPQVRQGAGMLLNTLPVTRGTAFGAGQTAQEQIEGP